ncbi:acyl dehydratase [Solimonas sp. K1W22B-7]|uniref:MaoC family dehydratase n=1 Tax=Solimonas sp. K1W22B-7 TaxID=2303331 RepID=UPI000E32F38E|nr:MaoC/PaaZ C-terminal domain-containing protein [Solimonas sp. K1W22B-7]AXQ29602.1 acyl dehydratase [Solimonas sp. K1W22B-7]
MLNEIPSALPLLLKAAATAQRKPGREPAIPELSTGIASLRADPKKLAAYCEVCGFEQAETLPITYPAVLANPLAMHLMAQPQFPLPMLGIVHVRNFIEQKRPLRADEAYAVSVRTGESRRVKAGLEFELVIEYSLEGESLYRCVMTVLHRIAGPKQQGGARPPAPAAQLAEYLTLDVPENQGRRYAAVSGDYNPIHLYTPTAKLLGFKRHIAHGMWSLARCAALLQAELGKAPTVLDVSFKQPLFLPAKVAVKVQKNGDAVDFALLARSSDKVHLSGSLR